MYVSHLFRYVSYWLRALVIVLAALIALAIGLLGYGLIKQAEDPNWRLFDVTQIHGSSKVEAKPGSPLTTILGSARSSTGALNAAQWSDLKLGLAPECRIAQITAERNRLVLSIEPMGPCRQIIIIDMDVGRVDPRQIVQKRLRAARRVAFAKRRQHDVIRPEPRNPGEFLRDGR